MPKKVFAILLALWFALGIHAQKLNVESFVVKTNDITARTQPRQDINGNDCALIKVQLAASGAEFGGNVVGNVSYNKSEYLVYMSEGSKRLSVKLEGYLPLEASFEDYGIKALEGKTTYVMTISGASVARQIEAPKIKTGWIILESAPSGAIVYINNEFVGNTPLNNYKQSYGTYQYRLESPNYHPATGTIELNAGRFEQRIALKPAFGSISVKANVTGARILLDGKLTGKNSPATLTEIPSGSHTITLQSDKYAPQQQNVVVEDGQTADISMLLDARFARITINSIDGAEIYSNGKLLGRGHYSEDMMEGYYDLEVRMDHYKSVTKQIQVIAGQSQDITLNPIPKYGSLDVTSTPHDADITIDGKPYGKTPLTVEQLLEGEHLIIVSLEGYSEEKRTVNILDGETVTVSLAIKIEKNIYLSLAGELKRKINDSSVERLKISGVMDARDFNYIKNNCKSIKYLDLSDVNVLSYSGFEGTDKNTTNYAANEIPLGAFFYWDPIDDGMPSLNEVILPVGIKRIGRNAFARAYNLKRINIPEGVEELSFVSFAICNSLKSIELPSSIKKIGRLAFADCKSLSTVVIRASYPPSIEDNSFNGIQDGAILVVPLGKGDLYRHSNWNRFFRIVEK